MNKEQQPISDIYKMAQQIPRMILTPHFEREGQTGFDEHFIPFDVKKEIAENLVNFGKMRTVFGRVCAMSEYKRLTIYDNGVAMALSADGKKEFSDSRYRHIIDRLAELEDKIEAGTLIELPLMKVLYPFRSDGMKDTPAYHVCYQDEYGALCDDYFYDDKEAAEKRLAELKGEKK